MVTTQASARLAATSQRTADKRLVEPTPKMQAVMVCVVEIGAPKSEAPVITRAAEVSAAKPVIGSSFEIRWPIVLMIFQPPSAVPESHCQGTGDCDPKRNNYRVDLVKKQKGQSDYTHGFLRVIQAVAGGHKGGRENLQFFEFLRDIFAVGIGKNIQQPKHHQITHDKAGEG